MALDLQPPRPCLPMLMPKALPDALIFMLRHCSGCVCSVNGLDGPFVVLGPQSPNPTLPPLIAAVRLSRLKPRVQGQKAFQACTWSNSQQSGLGRAAGCGWQGDVAPNQRGP